VGFRQSFADKKLLHRPIFHRPGTAVCV